MRQPFYILRVNPFQIELFTLKLMLLANLFGYIADPGGRAV
jgi:hypothetical protein